MAEGAEDGYEFYAGDKLVAYMGHYGIESLECSRCAAPAPLFAVTAEQLFVAAPRGLGARAMRVVWIRDAMLAEWGMVDIVNPSSPEAMAVLACPGCSTPDEIERTLVELHLLTAQLEYAGQAGSQN